MSELDDRAEIAMENLAEVNYRLRPAKSMERKMIADLLQSLSHIRPLQEYQYVGFGSIYFSDYRLFHRRLGIPKMISIEQVWEGEPRVSFNKPYECIELIMKKSAQALTEIDWENPTILWLDYTGKLNRDIISGDIQQFFANAVAGSVIFITVNAQPDNVDDLADDETHLSRLKSEFGSGNIPTGLPEDLLGTDLAEAYREILLGKVNSDFIGDRNAGLPLNEELEFDQLLNLVYKDSSLMFTWGGILNNEDTREAFKAADFDRLDFVSSGAEQYRIPQPNLTFQESRVLEEYMPGPVPEDEVPVPSSEIEDFKQVYRYFPRFTESEL